MPSGTITNEPSLVAGLETDEPTAERIGNLVAERFTAEDVAVSLADVGGGRWQVAIHFRKARDHDAVRAAVQAAAGPVAVAALQFRRVEAADWVRQSLAGLEPVTAGRFVVHGAHDRARAPANRIGIEIEAAMAFGTGHHGTTRGCLLALDAICKAMGKPQLVSRHPEARAIGAPRTMSAVAVRGSPLRGAHLRVTEKIRILDIGTGSGVLAIAAARALRARVLATDIDHTAVHTAHENVRRNRAGGLVTVTAANGVSARTIRMRAPFDLILANILLGPLQRIATPLRRLTAPRGRVVLSGILSSQANAAIAAYRPLALERRLDIDGWTTLILARRTPRRRAIGAPRSAPRL